MNQSQYCNICSRYLEDNEKNEKNEKEEEVERIKFHEFIRKIQGKNWVNESLMKEDKEKLTKAQKIFVIQERMKQYQDIIKQNEKYHQMIERYLLSGSSSDNIGLSELHVLRSQLKERIKEQEEKKQELLQQANLTGKESNERILFKPDSNNLCHM